MYVDVSSQTAPAQRLSMQTFPMRGQHNSLHVKKRCHSATMMLEALHVDFSSTSESCANHRLIRLQKSNTAAYRQESSTT